MVWMLRAQLREGVDRTSRAATHAAQEILSIGQDGRTSKSGTIRFERSGVERADASSLEYSHAFHIDRCPTGEHESAEFKSP